VPPDGFVGVPALVLTISLLLWKLGGSSRIWSSLVKLVDFCCSSVRASGPSLVKSLPLLSETVWLGGTYDLLFFARRITVLTCPCMTTK
jgi:hypothetical protein